MKICPECQAGNNDDAIYCKDCGTSLSKTAIKKAEDLIRSELEKRKRKEQRTRRVLRALIVVFAALDLVILGSAIFRGTMTFIMLLHLLTIPAGYASIFHPDALFQLNYSKDIENIHDVEPSDWYYFKCKAAGISVMILGTISLCVLAFA